MSQIEKTIQCWKYQLKKNSSAFKKERNHVVTESESFHQEEDVETLKSMHCPLVWGGRYVFKSLMTCSIAQSQQRANSQPLLLATDSELGWHVNVVRASFMTGRSQRWKWNQLCVFYMKTSWCLWSGNFECISANITTYFTLFYLFLNMKLISTWRGLTVPVFSYHRIPMTVGAGAGKHFLWRAKE